MRAKKRIGQYENQISGNDMQYFEKIAENIDTGAILDEINALENNWYQNTSRQLRCPAQAETNAIPLRGLRRSRIMGRRRRDVHETRYTQTAQFFPLTLELLKTFADQLNGELSRAKLARLPAGARVYPHVDRGEYYRIRDRYHLVVDSPQGSTLVAGDETGCLQNGELWRFDNKALHSAINTTRFPRIHLVFDLMPKGTQQKYTNNDASVLFEQLRTGPKRGGRSAIADAVQLYQEICHNPLSWKSVLEANGCVERAAKRPLVVLGELLWPYLDKERRDRRVSALSWALANIDIGRFERTDVRKSLHTAGGIRKIHELWRIQKDKMLYAGIS